MNKEIVRRSLYQYISTLTDDQQWRFSDGLQNELINVLENGQVYAKVYELLKDQEKMEKNLHEERICVLRDWQGDPNLEQKLLENDSRIVQILDELTERQQAVLRGLDVPTFRVTKTKREIELQILVLDFILTLGSIFNP